VPLIQNVTFQQVITDLKKNGSPGAEIITTDFIVLNGGNVGAPAGGSVITQPQPLKLYDEYEYYLYEVRLSANAMVGTGGAAATVGGVAYIPTNELEHLTLQLSADGRSRTLFRQPIPFSQFIGLNGGISPFRLDQWVALAGTETLRATIATQGVWNPGAIAAQLDFTITCVCTLVRRAALMSDSAPRRG
jgi:hypothetical protein